ncbi:MAG: hypothetical protein NT105_22640 [Verrucomicrobia bacterium]|nr:hypothetical protein [Verrucomicrobiota bacterium]
MPEEPHKNIEETLKAYAKQRRDATGEPLDMPSHTRAVLQREIAQRAAGTKPASRPWFEPLVALWPRLAVGAAAVAAAGIAMLVLTDIGKKTRSSMELAKVEPQAQSLAFQERRGVVMDFAGKLEEKLSDDRKLAMAQSAPTGGAERVAGEALGMKLKAADKLDGVQVATRALPAKKLPEVLAPTETKPQVVAMTAAPPPLAAPSPAAAAPMPATKPLAILAKTAPPSAPTTPVPAPTAPAEGEQIARTEASRLVTAAISNMAPLSQRLRFAQVASDSDDALQKQSRVQQPQPSQQVLASFQLEQVGDRVVITDADGSIYEGRIQLASESQQQVAQSRRATRARVAPTRADAPRQVMTQAGEFVWREKDTSAGKRAESRAIQQELFFTALGTNRSLNQRVVVNGTLSSPADGALAHGAIVGRGTMTFGVAFARDSNTPANAAVRAGGGSNAVMIEAGQIVLPASPAAGPVPAAPQASAQIEGTLRVGNTPEVEITAVGVGP